MARAVEFNQDEAIQRATGVFWEKGYNGASLRDLTDAMKINSSSLYNTIGDKHQLFVKCLTYYTGAKKALLLKRAADATSPLAAIKTFIDDAVSAIIKDANSCFAVKTAFEVSPSDTSIQAILKADNEFTHQFLSSLVEQAMEAGEMTKDEDPDLIADYLIGTYSGWYELYIRQRDPIKITRLAEFLKRQLSR
jgi:TetR/AcrR family transcriptional repressor of nem operon